MIQRTYDLETVVSAVSLYSEEVLGFDPTEWLSETGNIALTNDKGDVTLFERQWRHHTIVCGHYFFHSRGKDARAVAKDMLSEIFTGPYEVEIVVGFTPTNHLGALQMNKYLGFKSHGQIETDTGPHEFVMLTKQEWKDAQ